MEIDYMREYLEDQKTQDLYEYEEEWEDEEEPDLEQNIEINDGNF